MYIYLKDQSKQVIFPRLFSSLVMVRNKRYIYMCTYSSIRDLDLQSFPILLFLLCCIQTDALTTRCEYRACHLEIWEYDSSGTASFAQMSDIMKNAAQEYIDAAIEANDNQDQWDEGASEGITLLALIGSFAPSFCLQRYHLTNHQGSSIAHAFSFLINLAINEDDHVQNRNSIFGKAALVNFTKPHPPNETSFIFQREGKAGGFEVWIKFYPLAGPTGTLQTATLYSERLADPPQTVSG